MASHNARDPLRREAHILRQLKPLAMWRGSLVHDMLNRYFVPSLKSGSLIAERDMLQRTLTLADQQFAFSKERRYRSGISKSKAGEQFCALLEHDFGQEIVSDDISRLKEETTRCYANLYQNKSLQNTLRQGTWYGSEINVPFSLEGVTVAAILDLAFFTKDALHVVDWKIGESASSDYAPQMLIYALATVNKWNRSLETIKLWEVNLLKDCITEHTVTEDKLDSAEDFIYRSVSDILSLTEDRSYTELDFHDFDCANTSNTCAYCKFRSLCLKMLHE